LIPGLVTTIIPVHNRSSQLLDAVGSVLAQEHRPIEILIVDDGSDDGLTLACAQQLERRHPQLIRLLQRPNGGPGLARETGRLAACGEFLQYLDSDDVLLPGKFTAQVAALRQQPEADVAYGITFHRDRAGRLDPRPLKGTGEPIASMFPRFLNERWWETATPLYRRRICDQAGPWSDLLLEEDWEYDCRIAALGVRLAWVDRPVSEHRDHSGGRLSRQPNPLDPFRLRQRAQAQTLIHGHARHFGLEPRSPEMQLFSRSLFLLARQCGAAGLDAVAESLLQQSLQLCRDAGSSGWKQRLYRLAARRLGWRRAAAYGRIG